MGLLALVYLASRQAVGQAGSHDDQTQAGEAEQSTETPRDVCGRADEGTGEGAFDLFEGDAGGAELLEPELRDLVAQLLADGELVVTQEEGDVPQAAQHLLEAYQSRGGCVLNKAGYLDLLGSVWGCVVGGGQWVDVCLVSDVGDGTSRVTVLHLDADEVAKELMEVGVSDGRGP